MLPNLVRSSSRTIQGRRDFDQKPQSWFLPSTLHGSSNQDIASFPLELNWQSTSVGRKVLTNVLHDVWWVDCDDAFFGFTALASVVILLTVDSQGEEVAAGF